VSALVIGLDIGTTATKCVLLDAGRGVIAGDARPVTLSSPRPGWAEEDPEQWWGNACDLLPAVLAAAGVSGRDIRAIGISGMVPALLCLDAAGRVLRPSLQQNDARAADQVAELRAALPQAQVLGRTGSAVTQQSIGPKVAWLRRHEPDVAGRTAAIRGSSDYVAGRLADRTGPCAPVEANWALESGLYDFRAADWAADICAAAGVDVGWLGPVVPAGAVVGTVACPELPDLRGVPVAVSGADHVCGALAAGLVDDGDVVVELGGAGNILVRSPEPIADSRLYLDYHLVPGAWVPNGCMAATGSLVRWFQREIGGGTGLAALDAEAAAAGAGAGGIVLTPYFLGEKTPLNDPLARGTITGLHLGHGRGHLFRALLEGTAFGFRHHADVLRELGVRLDLVNLTGGGSRSPLWRQIIADVLGLPVTHRGHSAGAALGAAFAAGMSVGEFDAWDGIARLAPAAGRAEPDPGTARRYDDLYGVYRSLYPALLDQQHALARLSTGQSP
jgi:xylulokinase